MNILEQLPNYINYLSGNNLSLYVLGVFSYFDKLFVLLNNLVVDAWSLLLHTYGVEATVMSINFLTSIALLIFISGGIPSYSFDHLTSIGWVNFLTLVVCFLLIELVFIYTIMS